MHELIFESDLDEKMKAERYAYAFEMLELRPGPYFKDRRIKDAESLGRQVLEFTSPSQ
jgi:hypothetical protein